MDTGAAAEGISIVYAMMLWTLIFELVMHLFCALNATLAIFARKWVAVVLASTSLAGVVVGQGFLVLLGFWTVSLPGLGYWAWRAVLVGLVIYIVSASAYSLVRTAAGERGVRDSASG